MSEIKPLPSRLTLASAPAPTQPASRGISWHAAAADSDLMYAVAQEAGKQLARDPTDVILEIDAFVARTYSGGASKTVTLDQILARFGVHVDTVSLQAQVDDDVFTLDANGARQQSPPVSDQREIDPDGTTVKYAADVDLGALVQDDARMARDFQRAQAGENAPATMLSFAEEWREATLAGVDLVSTWERESQIRNLERAAWRAQALADRMKGS